MRKKRGATTCYPEAATGEIARLNQTPPEDEEEPEDLDLPSVEPKVVDKAVKAVKVIKVG